MPADTSHPPPSGSLRSVPWNSHGGLDRFAFRALHRGKDAERQTAPPWNPLRRVARFIKRLWPGGSRNKPDEKTPHRDYYSIAIYEGDSPLGIKPVMHHRHPALKASDVTDIPATYVADPFMVRAKGVWHMFFEILHHVSGKGVIGHATSKDGLDWQYNRVVLDEPFHLSYPYVFEFDGQWFMVPESHEDRSVRLYRAVDFPKRWEHVANLLEGGEFVDCSPFHHHGKWWLFAGCGSLPLRANTLRLFSSDELTGPWIEHPASPVVSENPKAARPGGRVVLWNGRLLRFCQDCDPHYGLRVRAFEITELTPETYREKPAAADPILQGTGAGWNATGMHHIDPHHTKDGRCRACVDGWYWGTRRL